MRFLPQILGVDVTIDVVDIGANPIDGEPPYKPLLEAGLARVTGFEPQAGPLARLQREKGPGETYLPQAVADGRVHCFRKCRASGMSSLLEPNQALLDYFHGFSTWAKVEETPEIQTVRLDDVAEIRNMDYLKLDIQGGELMVLQNAPTRLSQCVALQSEVEFLPLYVGQPLFSEVEQFLRANGFVLHKLVSPATRAVRPALKNNDIYQGFGQLLWADAVFIRDFTRLGELSSEQLLRLAVVLHDIYGARDIALRALIEYDRKNYSEHAARLTRYWDPRQQDRGARF